MYGICFNINKKKMEKDFIDQLKDIEGVEVIEVDDDAFEALDDSEEEFVEEEAPMPDDNIEVVDKARLTFVKHKGAVFCSDLNKTGDLAVTGGEDDHAFVWETATGTLLFECTGHHDSVIQVGFNYDDTLIATGDMGGMIQVWSVADKKLIWCYEGEDIEWLLWHPLANVLIGGCQSGDVYIWQVPQGNCKVLPSHGSRCNTGQLHSDGKRLLAGYEDGQIKFWDIKTATVLWTHSIEKPVTSLEINADGTLLLEAPCGSLLKVSDGTKIGTFLIDDEDDIESLLFIDELGVFLTGSLMGKLCVWDLGKHTMRHQAQIEWAVTIIKKGPDGLVIIGATDGSIYLCDVRTGTLKDTLTGHKADILSLTVAQDGTKFLSTADDGTAKIFDIKK